MHDDKISIIVPSYNHEEYLEACLDSIMFQNYGNLEIIIVDDFSEDGSQELIEQYVAKLAVEECSYAAYYDSESGSIQRKTHFRYPQAGREIKLLFNDTNLGSTQTYNRGFQAATGKFCSFVASDDICHPQLYSTLLQAITHHQADFAYADMFVIDDRQNILREIKLPEYSFKRCFEDWYMCGVATLYKRTLHEQFGYYDEQSKADDHECYLRFAMNGAQFIHVPRTLYSHRTHEHREVGLHGTERFTELLEESKRLTLKAREWSNAQGEFPIAR